MKCFLLKVSFGFFSAVLLNGCNDSIEYYDPLDPIIASNRCEGLGIVMIKAPKMKEQLKSFAGQGKFAVMWELEKLFNQDVRSASDNLVDVQLWSVKSNRYTKTSVDYVKTISHDYRVPGTMAYFAGTEYNRIVEQIIRCINECNIDEAKQWDAYLQEIIKTALLANATRGVI